MPRNELPRLTYAQTDIPLGEMGLVRAYRNHPNGNGRRAANGADSGLYVQSDGGFFVPPHLVSEQRLPQDLKINIDFASRSKERPKEYKDYMIIASAGESRFDFKNERHTEAMKYVDASYTNLQVNVEDSLRTRAEAEGSTIDQLREQMMEGRSIVERGAFLVPFNHHMPNKGDNGHYNGDFFYWDNLWSGKWARINNDPKFAKGVFNNFQYEYNLIDYIPNSNQIKISDRSQPPILPLLFTETTKLLTNNEEDNEWRREKVAFMKSEYFQVWVDDQEGEALYDNYDKDYHQKGLAQ